MTRYIDIGGVRFQELRDRFPEAAPQLALMVHPWAGGWRLRRSDLRRGSGKRGQKRLPAALIEALLTDVVRPANGVPAKESPAVSPSGCPSSQPEAPKQFAREAKAGRDAITSRGAESTNLDTHAAIPLGSAPGWHGTDGAVVGHAHLRCDPPAQCQDAAVSDTRGRPLAIVADGAGSAALSHLGARAIVAALHRLARTLDDEVGSVLDVAEAPPDSASRLAQIFLRHAQGVQVDLAAKHARSPADFRSTLLLWLIGARSALWVKVGDGALVAEIDGSLLCIGPLGKGEFANQTTFISPALADDAWAWGMVRADGVTGLVAMSDGAAERLVADDGNRVSPVIGRLVRGVSMGDVGRREIFSLLSDDTAWKGTTGDDKAIAIVGRAPPLPIIVSTDS